MKYYIECMKIEDVFDFPKKLEALNSNDNVVFNFSHMGRIEPLGMLAIGSMIHKYIEKYPDVTFDFTGTENKSYACTMGLFKYLSPKSDIGKLPGEAKGSINYIPITPIVFNELRDDNYTVVGDLIEKESGRLAKVISRENTELHKLLTYLIREILRNTYEHAEADRSWICGQYWPSYDKAEIGIIDEGIGIFESLTQNLAHKKYITDNKTALQWALKAGISESFRPSKKDGGDDKWANSGYGLYMASEICKYLHGSFLLMSYGNYIMVKDNKTDIGETLFEGTAIRMVIPTDNIKNAKDIIGHIANKGESESKKIKNAFKKASVPSRGLMDELKINL